MARSPSVSPLVRSPCSSDWTSPMSALPRSARWLKPLTVSSVLAQDVEVSAGGDLHAAGDNLRRGLFGRDSRDRLSWRGVADEGIAARRVINAGVCRAHLHETAGSAV